VSGTRSRSPALSVHAMRASSLLARGWKHADWKKLALASAAGLLLGALLLRGSDRWSAAAPSILDVRARACCRSAAPLEAVHV